MAIVIRQRVQVAGGIVGAGLGLTERQCFLVQLVQQVEAVLRGVAVGVRQVRQVAVRIVGVCRRILRIRDGRLDDGFQLVGKIVQVLHHVAGLVRYAGQVAGAIVGILRRGAVVV